MITKIINDMKRVAFFTTTRAEFGILSPLISMMEKEKDFEVFLFVGGAHLKKKYGYTKKEIIDRGFKIDAEFNYLDNKEDSYSLSKSTGKATIILSKIFSNFDFDFVCILGDRYELLSIAINAILFKKPIIHISGGEKTEGVIDDQIRHMITKCAHLHFVACEEYADVVRKLGESNWRVHVTGSLNVDNFKCVKKITKKKLFKHLNLDTNKSTILFTYHPVTLEYKIDIINQIHNLFLALKNFNYQVVITSPNVENDREKLIGFIKEKVKGNDNYHYFDSLGMFNYTNMLHHCEFIIGNSSSGIGETPFFRIPTINIGDRQKGRVRHKSIIDTDYDVDSIINGIKKAQNDGFKNSIKMMGFKFGDGTAAEKMVKIIQNITIDEKLMRKQLSY